MSEEAIKKKKSLTQRLITASVLIAALVVVLALGGWAFAVVVFAAMVMSLHEVFAALRQGGLRPVRWPSYVGLAAGIPLMLTGTLPGLLPIMTVLIFCVLLHVMFGRTPVLENVLFSVMPMFSLVLPGLCMYGILAVQPRALQLYMLVLLFAIPVMGDTAAYFVGSNVGGPKLCPQISPNKTISGAVGGLLGSVIIAVVVAFIFRLCCPQVTFPPLWAAAAAGLMGGVAGQLGDLFASMIKRHCGIKDYSNLFPGHGGMLDRMDSIVFNAIVIYCFSLLV